jgi:iron complex outermembrane receptor protein
MKQVKFKLPQRMLTLTGGLLLAASSFAQNGAIKGQVKDASGEPVMGATISVNGKPVGITDMDGNYSINVKPGTKLTITYLGMSPKTVTAGENMSVVLTDDSKALNEVVVIGYGTKKSSDLTGSVTAFTPDGKNKGVIVNAQDLIQGKIAGVNITSGGGTPGGGANIRIRGGSSLSATNDPLIVIDGIAMDNNGVQGLSNPLSLVNPQDIESFSVLKDASATAIYGSRGSNGVILITTKKGRKKTSISYNGSFSVSTKKKTIDVMNGDEFRDFVKTQFGEDSKAAKLLGTANTNWQDEILRTAFGHDHNITISGTTAGILPYRVSLGYTNKQGIIKTSNFERYTASLNLSPAFLQDHLKFNVNAKGMWAKNRYADGAAIGAAVAFDPTQSVYDNSEDAANFGGYFAWKAPGAALGNDKYPYTLDSQGTKNPVAILQLKNDRAISRDLLLSGDVDYKVHGLEDVSIHGTVGFDVAQGTQNKDVDPRCPLAFYYGSFGFDRSLKRNFQGSIYAMYNHDFNDAAKNHLDVMVGTEESHFWRKTSNRYRSYNDAWNGLNSDIHTDNGVDYDGDGILDDYKFLTESYLVSYFGRANWSLLDRYYLTATYRRDGSSRFKKHFSDFPSFAFMWKIKDESKLRNIKWLSDLKLRLGWGMTGQQEINVGDYPYFAIYEMNSGVGSYYNAVGNGNIARPKAYNPDLKWETTTTYNVGLDWGLFNKRITGSFDWYYRKTTDLLNIVDVPAGSNFRNQVISNIGSLTNTGIEAAIKWVAIENKDFNWVIDYNLAYNANKITKLNGGDDPSYFVAVGGISSGTGLTAQAHNVGHPAFSYYVYQQVYDKNGKAIEGAVVDRNGDGKITAADKYYYKNPTAPVTMGLSSRMEYKNWDFGFTLRASIGNYVFNDMMSGHTNTSITAIFAQQSFLSNVPKASAADNWQSNDESKALSDRWVQNASFLKCDNITLGYTFSNLFRSGSWNGVSGRVYGSASNVFTITKYKGIDPEVFQGIDRNLYPRPIEFLLGLSLNF